MFRVLHVTPALYCSPDIFMPFGINEPLKSYCTVKPSATPSRCSHTRRWRPLVAPKWSVPFGRFVIM
jgi:hypothetical protein